MRFTSKAGLLVLGLALAACSQNPGRFDNAGGAGSPGGLVPGSAADPDSLAYFEETIGDRVYFAVDQATLSPQAREIVAKQAAWLIEHPGYNAIIEGHADEQGTREYNLALGARRAASVRDFLVEQGVSPSRLRTVSYGKERPIALCSTEECYAKNRRAVTVLTAPGLTG